MIRLRWARRGVATMAQNYLLFEGKVPALLDNGMCDFCAFAPASDSLSVSESDDDDDDDSLFLVRPYKLIASSLVPLI